ncbi:MAG: HAD-IC family P-type ATPase [Methylibium sp.]|nr:HAD-IC family P-type ATPase [Methylibium sp.]MBA3591448.1 HAD-IC family P-type ATPase [Methylibium sp.]
MAMNVIATDHWHARTAEEALASLRSAPHGLDPAEASRRLGEHGPNALPEAVGRHPVARFLAQFHNSLTYLLLTAAVAAAVLDHTVDAAVIVGVVLINAIVGFIHEGKAEKALNAIRRMISPRANVLRSGQRHGVAVADLVPGDIVLLEPGDRVPADLRLVHARGLLIDEALLTGESVAAEKKPAPAAPEAPLGDRHSMVFSGTLVAAGQGSGVVVATGVRTQIGGISELLQGVEPLATPLQREINRFSRRFTAVALGSAAALFLFAVLVRGYDWSDALMAVVALAVGAIPEGMPTVITITLAIGVQRMAKRKAVIRHLPAVETLGATSVICSDKTGTLTRNEMTACRVTTGSHALRVTGSGHAPQGEVHAAGSDDAATRAAALADAQPLLRCGLLCNDAQLHQRGGAWVVEGDPMEGALLALAMKAGLDPQAERGSWPRLDVIPFDAAHRFMASLHRHADGKRVAFVKGAPEQVLRMCAQQLADGAGEPLDDRWDERIAAAASAGERVLGFGIKWLADDRAPLDRIDLGDLDDGVTFLGIVGFIDPPRDEVIRAIAECRSAGIDVKMITGDHAVTAAAIAAQLRIAEQPRAVTGAELDGLTDADLARLVRETSVFARTSPEHKLRIVRALQDDGAVVAMTGDGVNDAPSLKQANVGVAMGIKGTEAAKEAAQMVLLDDNFASIVDAVHAGRTVYDNIRKVIAWTLPTNGGEVAAVVAAIFIGFTLPMTAAQILWVNLVSAVTLGLALAFEPSEPGVMQRPPRSASASLLSPFLLWRVVLVSLLFMGITLGMFFSALARGHDLETARTIFVDTLVVLEVFYLFNVRYLHMRSMTLRGALGTPAVLTAIAIVTTAQLVFTYAPFMNALFETRPLAWPDAIAVIACGVGLFVLLELEKVAMRRLGVFDELGGPGAPPRPPSKDRSAAVT